MYFLWNTISFDEILPITPVKLSSNLIVYNNSKDSPRISEINSDYTKLEELLSRKEFKAADVETRITVSKSLHNLYNYEAYAKTFKNVSEHLELTPCHDMLTIDFLWSSYSDAQFGLGIQSNLLSQIQWGERTKYNLFSDLVGWRVNKQWLDYDSLTFSNKAPPGHLPYSFTRGRPIKDFHQKVSECEKNLEKKQ